MQAHALARHAIFRWKFSSIFFSLISTWLMKLINIGCGHILTMDICKSIHSHHMGCHCGTKQPVPMASVTEFTKILVIENPVQSGTESSPVRDWVRSYRKEDRCQVMMHARQEQSVITSSAVGWIPECHESCSNHCTHNVSHLTVCDWLLNVAMFTSCNAKPCNPSLSSALRRQVCQFFGANFDLQSDRVSFRQSALSSCTSVHAPLDSNCFISFNAAASQSFKLL